METATWTPITAAEHNLALSIERGKSARQIQHLTENVVRAHAEAGHEVIVTGGVVRCLSHDEFKVLDTSGARPGLIEANQYR